MGIFFNKKQRKKQKKGIFLKKKIRKIVMAHFHMPFAGTIEKLH